MGNTSPPRTLWGGPREGESEAKTCAAALPFLRSKVFEGDHGDVLDTDFGVSIFFAGVFRGEGEGFGLALGPGEETESRVLALRGGV